MIKIRPIKEVWKRFFFYVKTHAPKGSRDERSVDYIKKELKFINNVKITLCFQNVGNKERWIQI